MNLLDRLLGHDAWTTRQLLSIAAELSDEDLDREFDIGLRSLRRTFEHVIYNIEAWSDGMSQRELRPHGAEDVASLIARLDTATTEFAAIARKAERESRWDESWTDASDGATRSWGGTVAHVITHSMHHRAQIIGMLRRLGVSNIPEGDVLSWEEAES